MPAKKPPAKKTAAKKPAPKKAPAKKTAAKKPATKKPPAKKTATATKETKPKEAITSNGTIAVEDEISKSFLDYAMSVIVSRALPDVKDGLKPVQRRILYSMYETGIRPTGPFRKCSKVVGDVMGNSSLRHAVDCRFHHSIMVLSANPRVNHLNVLSP